MNRPRLISYPILSPLANSSSDDRNLEGVATNAKLLLKIIQEHQEADQRANNEKKEQRLAGMVAILDELKTKIQAARSSGKKRRAELRRCYTDLRSNVNPATSNQGPVLDEKEKLRRELNTSYAAQKRLGVMCSSLGKEKQIIARELALKVQELQELEELVNDLKVQNEKLREKVKVCALKHEGEGGGRMEPLVNVAALQERNTELSEQLLKSLEWYRSLKRKVKEAQEDNVSIKTKMQEFRMEVASGLSLMHDLMKKVVAAQSNQPGDDIEEQIREIASIFECLAMKFPK